MFYISPQRSDVNVAHASFGVVGLEVAGLGRIDDSIHSTFDLNTFTRLGSQVSVRLEPVISTRHQHAATFSSVQFINSIQAVK